MQEHRTGTVKYLTSDSLNSEGVVHAMFTRHGGVSPEPWDSLNFGSTVGDDVSHVAVNRQRAFESLGLDHHATFDVWQVHSKDVAVAKVPRTAEVKHQKADIIVTDQPGMVLLMRFADCVPLLMYDAHMHVAAIAHAGWLGTVKGVARATVEALSVTYHTDPKDLVAVIGPSIGSDHYEIGAEVAAQVESTFGKDSQEVLVRKNGSIFFDLWTANRIQLEQAGVRKIDCAEICTACHLNDWYSHRGQHGKTGRFGVLIGLRKRG
jgi:hypothetical protein